MALFAHVHSHAVFTLVVFCMNQALVLKAPGKLSTRLIQRFVELTMHKTIKTEFQSILFEDFAGFHQIF